MRLPPTANLTFLEGQYIDISGPQGIRRSYSIANSASGKLLKIWIKKVEGGAFSQYWFNEAKANDLVRIEGPKGSFFFREPKLNIIFMATGTGIAPVKSILDKLAETPDVFSAVSFSLYWGNRNVDDFFWQPSYTSLNLNYTPVLSKENEAWQGRVGYIQDIVIEDGLFATVEEPVINPVEEVELEVVPEDTAVKTEEKELLGEQEEPVSWGIVLAIVGGVNIVFIVAGFFLFKFLKKKGIEEREQLLGRLG